MSALKLGYITVKGPELKQAYAVSCFSELLCFVVASVIYQHDAF